MIIGIDASNLRSGGGVSHLSELLCAAESIDAQDLGTVIVWAGQRFIEHLPQRPWLRLAYEPKLDQPIAVRTWWQRVHLLRLLVNTQCDVLFAPGGTLPWQSPCPAVTMSRNMLSFEPTEAKRYGLSWIRLRLMLLRRAQARAFREADGVVFLTHYAHERVARELRSSPRRVALIPHGVAARFRREPRQQEALGNYSLQRPFQLLYVSIVDVYKHQWHIAEAVGCLRRQGYPITVDFVGPAYAPALRRLRQAIGKWDASGSYLRYRGAVTSADLHHCYHQADMFVFASSCENMPNILLEAMAAGLPIASSHRGPMPEILGDAGAYFDPEQPGQIAEVLRALLEQPDLRERCAWGAYTRAAAYSWERCARATFSFLTEVAHPTCVRPV
jgi:glycosyltransferase involved in cell wall biosynthesis